MTKREKIKELLTRGVEEVIVREDLEKKLRSGKKLRIKHGVDPTTKDLHLGYSVVYNRLRDFQNLGHKIVFLIGDFTARFGDPTDTEKVRTLRDAKEVKAMAKNYIDQVGKILDLKKTEIRYNSEWYDKMSAEDLLRLMSHFSSQKMMERDMFQERMKKGETIGLHEPVYPVLQAYDSVMLKSDFTVIGTDQTFNELKARDIQRDFGQAPQDVLAMKLLVGTDGRMKMSQSLGNYIGITESASQQYGKVMSIPDELIMHYFKLLTRVPQKELDKIANSLSKGFNPRDAKVRLAKEIVTMYHGAKAAEKAAKEFEKTFVKKEIPDVIPEAKLPNLTQPLADILVTTKLAISKSEARRLIEQGGVKVDGAVIGEREEKIKPHKGMVIQVGKRKFIKVK